MAPAGGSVVEWGRGAASPPVAWGRRQGVWGEATASQAGTLQSDGCPKKGSKEQGKGVRAGAAGADCPCLHAIPQSRPPSHSWVRLQPQCGPKMRANQEPPGSGCCGDYISSHLLSRLTQIYSQCWVKVDGSRKSKDGGRGGGRQGAMDRLKGKDSSEWWKWVAM